MENIDVKGLQMDDTCWMSNSRISWYDESGWVYVFWSEMLLHIFPSTLRYLSKNNNFLYKSLGTNLVRRSGANRPGFWPGLPPTGLVCVSFKAKHHSSEASAIASPEHHRVTLGTCDANITASTVTNDLGGPKTNQLYMGWNNPVWGYFTPTFIRLLGL